MSVCNSEIVVNSLGEVFKGDAALHLSALSPEEARVVERWERVWAASPRSSSVRFYARLQDGKPSLELQAEFRALPEEAEGVRAVLSEMARQWNAELSEWMDYFYEDEPDEYRFELWVGLWRYPDEIVAALAKVLKVTILSHPTLAPCVNHVI